MVTHYTREAGVRALERAIGGIVRSKAVEWTAHVDARGLSPSSRPSSPSPTVSDPNGRLINVGDGESEYDPVVEAVQLERSFGHRGMTVRIVIARRDAAWCGTWS